VRVSEKPLQRYPWYLGPFFWNQKRKYGQVLKPGLLWGRVPKLFMAVAILYGVLDRRASPLDAVLRSLVTVRVSQMNGCRFCVDINSATLALRSAEREAGRSAEGGAGPYDKVDALDRWRDSDLFDAKEKAALEYAEAMTDTTRRVTDAMVDRLREFFDEDAIVELTGLIAFQNLSSKFNSALDVPAQGFCRLPASAPSVHTGAHST
jgi:AhpD family alkylhydroperoxidase